MDITPSKSKKLSEDLNGGSTSSTSKCFNALNDSSDTSLSNASPSQHFYTLSSINEALDHYFSPKRKSPKQSPGFKSPNKSPGKTKSPGRPTKANEVNFAQSDPESDSNNEANENAAPLGCIEHITCDLKSLEYCFQEIDKELPRQYKNSFEQAKTQFSKWFKWLESGEFSIVLHGLGSKRNLLTAFFDYVRNETETDCVLVDGFKQTATVSRILERLTLEFQLTVNTRKLTVEKYAEHVKKAIDEKIGLKFFLIINSMDAQNLRGNNQQEALSILASSKNVYLICSVDHVNASLLWTKPVIERFSWLYVCISTGHCYSQELLASDSKALGFNKKAGGKTHSADSLEAFWCAIPANSRKILEQLAIHAPAPNEKNKPALTLPNFCGILRDEFATTSETTLQQQLIEFEDHCLIKKNKDTNIVLTIDRGILATFLEGKLHNA